MKLIECDHSQDKNVTYLENFCFLKNSDTRVKKRKEKHIQITVIFCVIICKFFFLKNGSIATDTHECLRETASVQQQFFFSAKAE